MQLPASHFCRVFAVLAAGCAAACTPAVDAGAPLADYSVLLIVIDSLRPDHLGAYGYEKPTSPFLDSLAASGVVFENAVANSSFTRESVASLFTGRVPSRAGRAGWNAEPGPDAPHLAALLAGARYRTGFFSNTVMLERPGFIRGFEESGHLLRRWNLSGEGERLSARALQFTGERVGEPFFLYLHYLDPHAPYAPAESFRRRLGGPPTAESLSLYDEVAPRLGALVADGFGPGDPRFEDLVRRYDAEIAATDAALAGLFRGLEAQGHLPRLLVVVTADHGEEFLEHGYVAHGWTLHRESVRVPLVFWAPGILQPARVTAPVSLVDVTPTLLDLVGVAPGADGFDGAPLFGTSDGVLTIRADERPQLSELLNERGNVLRSVTHEGWKYVATWRFLSPETRHERRLPRSATAPDLAAAPEREALYDLARDPGETRNRLDEEPDRAAALRRLMRKRLGRGVANVPGTAVELPEPDPEEAERLRALGYL